MSDERVPKTLFGLPIVYTDDPTPPIKIGADLGMSLDQIFENWCAQPITDTRTLDEFVADGCHPLKPNFPYNIDAARGSFMRLPVGDVYLTLRSGRRDCDP